MVYLSILLLAVSLTELAMGGPTFMIKHELSGVYVHPEDAYDPIKDNDHLVTWDGYHSHMYMTFDIQDGEWGYIRHINSGKIFHPYSGSISPSDNTKLVLNGDHKPWAYFALDQVNNHIIHYGGKYIHPDDGASFPKNGKDIVLHGDIHNFMEWELVSPSNTNQIVYPYGDAVILGEWRLVFSVENPLVTHTQTISFKLGKSHSESISSSFEFVWEASATAQFWFAEMSTSASLSAQIQQTSTESWYAEIEMTNEVQVVAGQSVAVWQRDFIGEKHGHKAFHMSNMFAHTDDPNNPPGEDGTIKYRFI